MTRKLLVGAIVAGALTVTAGTALALSQGGQPTSGAAPTTTSTTTSTSSTTSTTSSATSTPTSTTSTSTSSAPAELSADDASRLVRERMGGVVHEIEREVEHGRLEWKVEITARDGRTYDVRVDAVTGDVTRIDQDSDDDRDDDRDDDSDDDSDDDRGKGRHGDDD